MINKVAVIGAGTMGAGIAFASAQAGFIVVLYDLNDSVLENAQKEIDRNLSFLTTKRKISEADANEILERLLLTNNIDECEADLIIEAIVEKLEIKIDVFKKLAELNPESTILASNTSSLSINAIQEKIDHPNRVAGLHFFNPAHIMKLVEIVEGKNTDDATINELRDFCKKLNKVAVLCKDSPGFIVNRVARPYYLEAMRIADKTKTPIDNIDKALEASGFKMGAFKLMDLIGLDINLAVSKSVYEAMNKPLRFEPHSTQIEKVEAKKLGKKSGEGFYKY